LKSVIVGNGLNIQFGGVAYSSSFIMKRVKYKAKMDGYKELFNNSVTKEDIIGIINGFVSISNDIIDNKYDDYIKNEDEREALLDYKSRYDKIQASHEIMLEDWFFILHMFFLKNADISDNTTSSKQGFERLILDAIYNDGDIQNLHTKMNRKVKRFFNRFDNIFTLNYDNNLERLTGKDVLHLHGDYSILHSSENPDYVSGYLREKKKERVVINGYKHCFCNALLDYSGKLKLRKADLYHRLNIDSERYRFRYENDQRWKNDLLSCKADKPNEYEMIMTKINNPSLEMASEYNFDKLRRIEGELYILGMSPNNDDHIFGIINENDKIEKVYFYYFSESEKQKIEDSFLSDIYECKSILKLWSDLGCEQKGYKCNYKIPSNIDDMIKIFNGMSDDPITKNQIINEVNSIPQFEMDRLCMLVKRDLKSRNPDNSSTDEAEFSKTNASISYIALKEGILPSSLYMICVMNWSKR
jgi:hypothetical protein